MITKTKRETQEDVILFRRESDGRYLKLSDYGGGPGGGSIEEWVTDPMDATRHVNRNPHNPLEDVAYYLGPHCKLKCKPVRGLLTVKSCLVHE